MSKEKEIRFAAISELRASGSADQMILTGYPCVYNSLSSDLGGFREQLLEGCFDESLADDEEDRTLLYEHDGRMLLGRESNGTLQLSSDKVGLKMRAELPNTSLGRDVFTLCKRGDIKSMSFGMYVDDDSWDESPSDIPGQPALTRSVKKARIFEVSAVSHPAYNASSVSARSLFPDGVPASIETRCKRSASSVDVSDRDLAFMRARIELAKRS
jgi:HK97 family phage prohead protease